MKTLFTVVAFAGVVIALSSCDLIKPPGGTPSTPVRILALEYTLVPDNISDDVALTVMLAKINEPGYNHPMRQNATGYAFPTADTSATLLRHNRVFVTLPGSSFNGGTTIIGGHDGPVLTLQPNTPSALSVAANGVHTPVDTGYTGDYSLFFYTPRQLPTDARDTLKVGGSTSMEFILESYNSQTTFATGTFVFVGRNLDSAADTRRWAVRGSFTLDDGRQH